MNAKYPSVSTSDVPKLLAERPYAVIHFDASWDSYRSGVKHSIESVIRQFTDVSFAYVDVDDHPDCAIVVGIVNVPSCAYYREGELIAVVIGANQDIARNIALIKEGKTPDVPNGIGRFEN